MRIAAQSYPPAKWKILGVQVLFGTTHPFSTANNGEMAWIHVESSRSGACVRNWRWRGSRKRHSDTSPGSVPIGDLNITAITFDKSLADGEPESKTTCGSSARRVPPPETLKHMGEVGQDLYLHLRLRQRPMLRPRGSWSPPSTQLILKDCAGSHSAAD